MNNPLDPTLRELDDCGCCSGTAIETPVEIDNRPGLGAISFRAGKQPQFKATMLASLSAAASSALQNLKTRDDDDFTIALLDGWATIADVLTFYSERIANESYLRTATERGSVLELARSIGYELNPGVAASTYLAFTVDESTGAPGYANIDAGTKVQSIPGPDETAQVFETLEDLYAHKNWNSMAVKSTRYQTIDTKTTQLYLSGTTTNLNPGDALLIIDAERESDTSSTKWDLRRVKELETFPDVDAEKSYTIVTLDSALDSVTSESASDNLKVYALRQRPALFGANAPEWKLLPADVQKTYEDEDTAGNLPPGLGSPINLSPTQPIIIDGDNEWPHFKISGMPNSGSGDAIYLDAVYSGIISGSWIVLSLPDSSAQVYRIKTISEDSPAEFGLTTKSTKLTLDLASLTAFDDHIRDTVVFAQSEELPWAKTSFYDAVFGEKITLDQPVSDLSADRLLLVSGLPASIKVIPENGFKLEFGPADSDSDRIFEVATLKEKTPSEGSTSLVLTEPLKYAYDPTTVIIYGNVAYATEGETTSEILGSGDATQGNQSFELSKTPLTYVPAATVTGGESTLKITVNDVEWTEVPSLYDRGPLEHIYVTRLADDGTVTVIFGDGKSGARLPTGQENVKATYRTGTGVDGLLEAEQLSLLITRPLGVKSVTNPEATEGAADPQELEDARENAPTTVLTLDRVVSQLDYEDFARNFSGIAKALATWTWNEHSRGIYVTIAGEEGVTISADSSTITSLHESLLEYGNPLVPIQIASYTPVSFKLAGTIYADSDRDPDDVGTAVNDALKSAFSFDARDFGQPVTLSEVEAIIQNVEGVSYVDLDALYVGNTSKLETYLAAQAPRDGAAFDEVAPAELLTLNEDSLSGLEVKTV
jgi:predicted phage baseplate assembly protein